MTFALSLASVLPLAHQAAQTANVPVALLLAIAKHESVGFHPDARREEPHLGDGSHGLMQVLLSTARQTGYAGTVGMWDNASRTGTGLYNPLTNLKIGAAHLRSLLNATHGDVPTAISAYNAGLGNAKRATVPSRFCVRWKASAPRSGRVLERDCAEIRNVKVGEFPNQPYVDRVMGYLRDMAVVTRTPQNATAYVVGSGGGVGPAGDSSSGPSSDSSTTFVVSTPGAILLAAVTAAILLWRRFAGGQ